MEGILDVKLDPTLWGAFRDPSSKTGAWEVGALIKVKWNAKNLRPRGTWKYYQDEKGFLQTAKYSPAFKTFFYGDPLILKSGNRAASEYQDPLGVSVSEAGLYLIVTKGTIVFKAVGPQASPFSLDRPTRSSAPMTIEGWALVEWNSALVPSIKAVGSWVPWNAPKPVGSSDAGILAPLASGLAFGGANGFPPFIAPATLPGIKPLGK